MKWNYLFPSGGISKKMVMEFIITGNEMFFSEDVVTKFGSFKCPSSLELKQHSVISMIYWVSKSNWDCISV